MGPREGTTGAFTWKKMEEIEEEEKNFVRMTGPFTRSSFICVLLVSKGSVMK